MGVMLSCSLRPGAEAGKVQRCNACRPPWIVCGLVSSHAELSMENVCVTLPTAPMPGVTKVHDMSLLAPLRELDSTQRHTVLASFLGWTLDAFDYFLLTFVIVT